MISVEEKLSGYLLVASDSEGKVQKYDLQSDRNLFIGSSMNCGFRLTGQGLAPIHCHMTQENGSVFVKDWMSSGGTYVNGKMINDSTELTPDDTLEVGCYKITIHVKNQPDDVASRTSEFDSRPKISEEKRESPSRKSIHTAEASTGDQQATACEMNVSSAFSLSFDGATQTDEVDTDFFDFSFDGDEQQLSFDRETVELLRAEIEDLRASLAMRDAELEGHRSASAEISHKENNVEGESPKLLSRLQELIDEANRSDERASLLEDMLHAAEDANRSEQEERRQLESWVTDIENRIGQREGEHAAEIDGLRQRLTETQQQQFELQERLKVAAQTKNASKEYDETLEALQRSKLELQEQVDRLRKERTLLTQKVEQLSEEQEKSLREERAALAKEQAKLARMRFELSSKLAECQSLPKSAQSVDQESATRIQALREHLREIHSQELSEEKEAPLMTRLSKLWKRLES